MTPNPEQSERLLALAGELTKAQRTALHNLSVCHERRPWDWHEAPHDGWRRAGAACNALWRLELAKIGGRRKGLSLYRLTPLGLALVAHLRARAGDGA